VPRHAHKRGLYTEGKGFKGNIDSSNPSYSFHYIGSSNRLYVFEAPIDLLSFITIHKDSDWKKHSYIALCGLSEQALFKSLECNSELAHVVLCLDHDSAGIEASEKIEDMLAERNLNCSRLVPCFKDWNEDLKEAHNCTAIPAEEHPQHQFKNEICEEILLIVKDLNTTHIEYSDGEQILKQVRNQNEHQAEAMKLATAVFLCLTLREYRQLGNQMTVEEIVQSMSEQFRAYQNRSRWDPKLTEAVELFSKIKKPATIIREVEKMNAATGYLAIALELLKATIKLELHEQKQVQATVLKMA
jgi:DNA primase